jgi:hypothetical protein
LGAKQSASAKATARQPSHSTLLRAKAGADDGIRTRDLRFTKPLLYQLSYVGRSAQTLHRAKAVATACDGLSLLLRVLMVEINSRSFGAPDPAAVARIALNDQGRTNVSPISRSAMRSGVLLSAA